MKKHDVKDLSEKESPQKPNGQHDHEKMQHGSHERMSDDHAAGSYGLEGMARVEGRREAISMRPGWSMGVEGSSAVVRILLPKMHDKITGRTGHEGT